MHVIPAIDLRGGRCVRLLQGDFDRETEYSTNPTAVATEFAQLGAATLHLVDLDGARSGNQGNEAVVREIAAESPLAVQLGGGIRERQRAESWFAAGVSRCVVGSVAVTDPDEVKRWIAEFGAERIVLALDVRINATGTPLLATDGWEKTSDVSLWDCLDHYADAGAQHVLCTDVRRDGALSGPNVELYAAVVAKYPKLQLQASGGVRDVADLHALAAANCAAAITGRALLDGKITKAELSSFQRDA